ncbi:MAG: beta-3-deoxy-D-manno-oct-2-ulosonic acid transferase [Croceicoccus sp.]|nr:beta-3-deoxy-D-manno-oct-2-ulosonic acid transferase [Croceicoccus sp.]
MTAQPLLRPPTFPGGLPVRSQRSAPPADTPLATADREALVEQVRQARVGGDFWGPRARPTSPFEVVFRPRSLSDVRKLLPLLDRAATLWIVRDPALRRLLHELGASGEVLCAGDVDPWSVLPDTGLIRAHGDDEWLAIARIAGVRVEIIAPGRYGKPGDDAETLDSRAAAALNRGMADPFGSGWLNARQAIALLADWRRTIDANRGEPGHTIVAASGIAWWKRAEIRHFLWTPGQRLRIVSSPRRAVAVAAKRGGALAIWPSRVSPALLADAERQGVPVVRVEDGFVRSVGLGSNLVPPSSIIVDRRGIHFDPSAPSALEDILATADFSEELLIRARALAETILSAGISKYAAGRDDSALPPRTDRRVVLVPGQVEDDMSVLEGGGGLTSNRELLRRVRALEPDAEIWWRPHPDVDAGHRRGAVADEDAMIHADRIMRGGSMAALLDRVDAVHVLTSLTGFEALMRSREVICHGTPFYAGWGLTRDLGPVPDRRGRKLDIDQLVAAVLILYPRYLDPVTRLPCPPETLVARMSQDSAVNRQGWVGPLRRWQGRAMSRLRSRLKPGSR